MYCYFDNFFSRDQTMAQKGRRISEIRRGKKVNEGGAAHVNRKAKPVVVAVAAVKEDVSEVEEDMQESEQEQVRIAEENDIEEFKQMSGTEVDGSEQVPAVDKVVKPRNKKKGKKFASKDLMMSIIDQINIKQEAQFDVKTEKLKKYKKIQNEQDKKIKQRRMDRKIELKEKKRELLGTKRVRIPDADEDENPPVEQNVKIKEPRGNKRSKAEKKEDKVVVVDSAKLKKKKSVSFNQ